MASTRRVRFRPPEIDASPGLLWLLAAAFADTPPAPPPGGPEDGEELVALAEKLGLAERVWVYARSVLERSTAPSPLAAGLRRAHARAAATAALYTEVAARVAHAAAELGTPLVFLKGYALLASGQVPIGGRAFSDLDVLVTPADAESLHHRLREHGFAARDPVGNEQHLSSLVSPEGGAVDLHFCLRGLALDGRRWATVEHLAARDLLEPLGDHEGSCYVPTQHLMAAHLMVHALAQHIWLPHQYPLLRFVGDLIDLLPNETAWTAFTNEYRGALDRSIPPAEREAVGSLKSDLQQGRIPDLTGDKPEPAAVLLRHFLAGAIDPRYSHSLKPRHTLVRLREAAGQGKLLSYLGRKIGSLRHKPRS